MICPYCGIGINTDWYSDCYPVPIDDGEDYDEGYKILSAFCPACNKYIIRLQYGCGYMDYNSGPDIDEIEKEEIIYPKFPTSKQIHQYVPQKYKDLFIEASQVNNISPRASATLSRYLLQMVLHEELHINKRNLAEEISSFESKQNVPSKLITMLHVMRRVANFGAHPKKSTHSNEIVEIEQGESDVMLELIDELFEYVFIKPKQEEEFLKNIEDKYGIKPSESNNLEKL